MSFSMDSITPIGEVFCSNPDESSSFDGSFQGTTTGDWPQGGAPERENDTLLEPITLIQQEIIRQFSLIAKRIEQLEDRMNQIHTNVSVANECTHNASSVLATRQFQPAPTPSYPSQYLPQYQPPHQQQHPQQYQTFQQYQPQQYQPQQFLLPAPPNHSLPSSPCSPSSASGSFAGSEDLPEDAERFELRFEGVKSSYFSERNFPEFTVRVFSTTRQCVHTQTEGWVVELNLLDGYGNIVNQLLKDDKLRYQHLSNGVAQVLGQRILKVSSKHGDFFQFQAVLHSPTHLVNYVASSVSPQIVIKSVRLFRTVKSGGPGEERVLCSSDQVSDMPGIGRQYSARLKLCHVETIADLAALTVDQVGNIVSIVRKEKGNLTQEKLWVCVREAKDIVQRERGDDHDEEIPVVKRQRVNQSSSGTVTAPSTTYPHMTPTQHANYRTLATTSPSPPPSKMSLSLLNNDLMLMVAIATQNLKLCENIVRENPQVVSEPLNGCNGLSGLMVATLMGAHQIVRYLLTIPQVDPNLCREKDGFTALHLAVFQKRELCVKELVECSRVDLDLNATRSEWHPLTLAIAMGNLEIAKMIAKAIPVTQLPQLKFREFSLMHLAVASAQLPTICFSASLFSPASTILEEDTTKVPSLVHLAVGTRKPSILQWLIEHGAAVNRTFSEHGWAPLHIAAINGDTDIVSMLLEQNTVDVNVRTKEGWTALSLCGLHPEGSEENTREVVKLLLGAGALDSGSDIPASVVSLVAANMFVLQTVLGEMGIAQKIMYGGCEMDVRDVVGKWGDLDLLEQLNKL
eukprot:c8127_g1_i1.p1 GENE.c8127_g1_i1~~c8127_g1_i1.p1  ORF type:complete len:807 (-),score=190.27 c8127_g1_i1:20-2416(-)